MKHSFTTKGFDEFRDTMNISCHMCTAISINNPRILCNPKSKHSRLDRMPRLTPNPRPILVKHKRHRRHQRRQTSHNGQSVRDSHILVERRGDDHHATRSDVPDHRSGCEGAGGVNFVGVDDVLVTGIGEAWSVLYVSSGEEGRVKNVRTHLVMKMHKIP
jgi:hypothetical protein